ncbi:prepilin-type N-terminal cleavage/methylation domain-containing protein [bacterium]|nr:MAG: prepilin-type N-terminal cleavage/methylation domain-containing protein [bacterium]
MKRAFTLIELLVVIAIIAILAAILFPVFAQAKAAAKATAAISNDKQLLLAAIMYSGDSDDVQVIAASHGGDGPLKIGDSFWSPWSWLIQPYVKTGDLFVDPLAASTPTYYNSRAITMGFFPNFGYNYIALSPYTGSPARQVPVSATAAADPAGTVAIVSRGGITEGDGYFWSFDFGATSESPLLNTTIEVPDCYTIPMWCADNWGKNGFASGIEDSKYEQGARTGGMSKRNADSAIVGFVDGHTKKLKASATAAGTNWNRELDHGSLQVTDKTKYLWDLE